MEIVGNSTDHFKLWSELELQEFPEKFVIRSPASHDQGFSISRYDGTIEKLNGETNTGKPSKISIIYGVAGTIRLLAGAHVLVITSRKKVGAYLDFPIFRVTSMKFLSCNEASKHLSSEEKRDEAYFMNLLKVVESTPGLYFSYETDITLNMQRRYKLSKGWMRKPVWKQADPRFVWNRNLVEELIENKLDGYIIPLIQGSFQTAQLNLKGSTTSVTLISRRCTRRLGTRMWRRGANLEGDTANFIETEQFLEFGSLRSSFLQVRGSIPLLWEQIVDLSYKPQLNIIYHEETQGDEGKLSTAYAAEMQKLPNVRYVSFDFHHICGSSSFENIELLYDQISEDFEKQGFFMVDKEGEILAEQKGIIRSNCIDCLDRTNVTQCYLAQKSLNSQLQRLGAISSTECISTFSEDFGIFKALWVQQGDEISLEYSGTYALKGDLVRYGKQTMAGLLRDGMSALSRYFLNNFQDGVRQDAMDLISGRYTVNRGCSSLAQRNGYDSITYLPVASALLLGGLTVTTVTLNQVLQFFCNRTKYAEHIAPCTLCWCHCWSYGNRENKRQANLFQASAMRASVRCIVITTTRNMHCKSSLSH
ncbi:PREDICTED: phosphoinositide phosphatase SAC8 isoform X2 [Ipomoea nil]|uniref:phosphoinositide phosphatase SAC8 isoform X2 n=1 Tax=Ipomoea nil TaxID=35883 RepID=UPI000900B745|nr:PREDICTED: phosphoinositide phosphatase SAC8 isoform X2 [Ipomoea nil]